jgi:hypothetical protein
MVVITDGWMDGRIVLYSSRMYGQIGVLKGVWPGSVRIYDALMSEY